MLKNCPHSLGAYTCYTACSIAGSLSSQIREWNVWQQYCCYTRCGDRKEIELVDLIEIIIVLFVRLCCVHSLC